MQPVTSTTRPSHHASAWPARSKLPSRLLPRSSARKLLPIHHVEKNQSPGMSLPVVGRSSLLCCILLIQSSQELPERNSGDDKTKARTTYSQGRSPAQLCIQPDPTQDEQSQRQCQRNDFMSQSVRLRHLSCSAFSLTIIIIWHAAGQAMLPPTMPKIQTAENAGSRV